MMKQLIIRKVDEFIKRSHWYNEVLFKDCRKFWDLKDEQFDVVNLGSGSGVSDFCYDNCDLKGANWAVAPQSTLGDFVVLKQFRHYIKDGGVVIYPLCPFTAISGGVAYLAERCYSFIDYRSFPGGHYITNNIVQGAKNNPLSIYPLVEFVRDIKWNVWGGKMTEKTEAEMVCDANLKIRGWKEQFGISNLDERFVDRFDQVFNSTVNLFREIIEYCNTEGLRMVVVVPPVYRTLSALLTLPAREQLLDTFMEHISGNEVELYNFIDSPEFSNNRILFRDSYNLNVEGARRFTDFVLSEIKKN